MKSKLYFAICILCCISSITYLNFFAKDRYLSKSNFSIVVDDSKQAFSSEGLLSLIGGSNSAGSDLKSTIGFIHSADLLMKLEKDYELIKHFSQYKNDFIYNLAEDAPLEKRLGFYRQRIHADMNSVSGLIELHVETYDAKLSLIISERILKETEQFINDLSKKVANEKMEFVKTELARSQEGVEKYKTKLLEFQNTHKIIHPEAIITSRLEAIHTLKLEKINREVRLSVLRSSSLDSPVIPQLEATIKQLEKEITLQEANLSGDKQEKLNQLLAEFKALQLKLKFAIKLQQGAEILLEKTRAEAIAKSRFFSVIQSPYLAEEHINPRRTYLSVTWSICIILVFYIIRAMWMSVFDRV